MRRATGALSIALLLGGCATTSMPVAAESEAVAPTGPVGVDIAPIEGGEETTGDVSLDEDIGLAMHGALVDHIGPEAADALARRLAARPGEVLDRFAAIHLRSEGDSMRAIPPSVRTHLLLARLHPHLPTRVQALASRLALIDEEALREGSLTGDAVAERIHALRIFAAGLDVEASPAWSPVAANSSCLDFVPGVGSLIRLRRDCTCGQPHSCAAVARGGRVEVLHREDPGATARCRDCYPNWTACQLPALPSAAAVPVSVNGVETMTLRTAPNGVPVDFPRCLP